MSGNSCSNASPIVADRHDTFGSGRRNGYPVTTRVRTGDTVFTSAIAIIDGADDAPRFDDPSARPHSRLTPTSMVIQPRDVNVLLSVYRHRFLTSDHVHALYFGERCLRSAQARLRELHLGGFLERTYLLAPVGRERPRIRPLYSLARAGAALAADRLGRLLRSIPHTPTENRIGYEHLLHELVVTDFLVAAQVVLRRDLRVVSIDFDRDHALRSALSARRLHSEVGGAVVPDAALTIASTTLAAPTTLYLEVVQAGVKGGNARLVEKLNRYVSLNRARYFARVFGHGRVRGVAVISPSEARIENLREFAQRRLAQGRRFVWFAVAPRHSSRTHPPTTFTAETLVETAFRDLDGNAHQLTVDAFR